MPSPRPPSNAFGSTLLWLPVNAAQAAYTLLWSAGWISVALAAAAIGGRRPALALARDVWAPGLLAGAGARLVIAGREHLVADRAQLVVVNHQSWIDVPALFRGLGVPLQFLAKRELRGVPLLGWYMRAVGTVFVDRRRGRDARAAVDAAARHLVAGGTLVTFPEGTRSRDGALGGFKHGGFLAAIVSGAAVVPAAIVGSGRVLPAGGFRVRPGTIELRIGPPIDPAPFAPADRAGLARAAERAVARLLAGG